MRAQMTGVSGLPDPCPRPETLKRRVLNDRQRLLYAPMADLGGLVYDKDAVYIDIPDWKVRSNVLRKNQNGMRSCHQLKMNIPRRVPWVLESSSAFCTSAHCKVTQIAYCVHTTLAGA